MARSQCHPPENDAHMLGLSRLPQLREFESPRVVLVFDEIRRNLYERDEFAEFCWFAREYSRCYRFHCDGAAFRLRSIHGLMSRIAEDLVGHVGKSDGNCFSVAVGDQRVQQVYWDFESFLSEVCIALDLLARIVGPAFKQHTPLSFSRLCKVEDSHPLLDLFCTAQQRWVTRLKDYRDCFTHYTPVDTLLMVSADRRREGWRIRAKLPVNPNAREIEHFRFSWRVELLSYAINVHRRLVAFDRALASGVLALYKSGRFPVRTDSLLGVGQRERKKSPDGASRVASPRALRRGGGDCG